MAAEEVPTQSQGQTATEAVNGPCVSPPILTHTHQISLICPCGSSAQSKRVKNSSCFGVGGGVALTWVGVS